MMAKACSAAASMPVTLGGEAGIGIPFTAAVESRGFGPDTPTYIHIGLDPASTRTIGMTEHIQGRRKDRLVYRQEDDTNERRLVGQFDDLVAGALDLASTWDAIAHRCGEPTCPTSACAREASLLPAQVDQPDRVMRAIVDDAVLYITAAAQQLRALVCLVGPEIVLTGWTVTRTLAEHCGRVTWLLDPDTPPEGRLARSYMERIVSIQMARLALASKGQQAFAKQLKREREALIARARRSFPDLELFDVEALNEWSVGGEQYASLGRAVNDLGRKRLSTKRLYDTLSTFTHPSIYRLSAQTRSAPHDNHVRHQFYADPETVRWQFATACLCVQQAALDVVSYLELDAAPLDEWAERNPALLNWPRQARSAETN